eukprot:TRINITY_DN16788_c0_g1_i1.p1 TRINITY_DN16788_c0_g1~~TRINITY_DN16788_c0_g1_i1.p1  ORF type:complete len:181 (-),score=45.26 TRINITY_DN16788_c0_g1_i1:17-559(-)
MGAESTRSRTSPGKDLSSAVVSDGAGTEAELEAQVKQLQGEVDGLVARISAHRSQAPSQIFEAARDCLQRMRPMAASLAEATAPLEERGGEEGGPAEEASYVAAGMQTDAQLAARLTAAKAAYASLETRIREAVEKMTRVVEAAEEQQARAAQKAGPASILDQIIADHSELAHEGRSPAH